MLRHLIGINDLTSKEIDHLIKEAEDIIKNPSKYADEERGKYLNWLKHNKKLYASGLLKGDRVEAFKKLMELNERYRRKNQYE